MKRLKQVFVGLLTLTGCAIVAFFAFAPAYIERSRNVTVSSDLAPLPPKPRKPYTPASPLATGMQIRFYGNAT